MFEAFEVSPPRQRPAPPEAVPVPRAPHGPAPAAAPLGLPDPRLGQDLAQDLGQQPGAAPPEAGLPADFPAVVPLPPRRTLAPADEPPPPPEPGFSLPVSGATFALGAALALALAYALGVLSAREGVEPSRGASAEAAAETALDVRPTLEQPREREVARKGAPAPSAGTAAAPRAAAEPTSRGSGTGPATNPPAAAAPAVDDATRAFLDPRNQFTLQLVSYDGSPNGRSLADHWLGVLRGRGLPAVLRQVGTKLALFVGASPNSLEIEELQRRVLEVRGTRGEPVFPSARVVSLKDFR